MRRVVLLGLSILSLTGCGGSGDAGKVAKIARSESEAQGATCDKVRDDAVSGQLVALYSCTLTNVPPAHRLAGSFDSPTQHYCFAYASEMGVNMTQRYGPECSGSAPAAQSGAVVHVYFCTSDTCTREATQAQMDAVKNIAAVSPLVEKVVFISKEKALRAMKEKHPKEAGALPANPFPDALTVIPKRSDDVEEVAAIFRADPPLGIDKVDYSR
jgi:FtsX extracellular domain